MGYPVASRSSGRRNAASSHQTVCRLRFSRRPRRLDQGEAERKEAAEAEAGAYPYDANGAEAWRGARRRRLAVLGNSRSNCLPGAHPRYSPVHRQRWHRALSNCSRRQSGACRAATARSIPRLALPGGQGCAAGSFAGGAWCGSNAGNNAARVARAGTSLNSDVVNEACLAKPCRDEQANRSFLDRRDGRQCQRVTRLKIIQVESSQIHFDASHIQDAVDFLAAFDTGRATFENFIEHRGDRALCRRKVHIARGKRQTVRLTHRWNSNDLHGQVEVPSHLGDDAQLLVVFLPEERKIRRNLREQFGNNGRDTAEKMWTEFVLESGFGWPFWRKASGKPFRIHGLDCWRPDDINVRGAQSLDVG